MSEQGMKMTISPFPGESKKNTRESNMLIDISLRESVISPLLLVVVLCGYQIYQFLKLVYDLFMVALEAKWHFLSNFLFFHFSIDIYVH